MGQRGHEVHVITRGLDQSTIDFEEGVWVHRIAVEGEPLPRLRGLAKIQKNVTYATAVHREVKRLSERRALDLVEAPIWDTEGLACLLDNDLTTVTSLQTTFKVLADMHPSWNDTSETPGLRALEAEVLRRSGTYHAISRAILETIGHDYGLEIDTKTIGLFPLGLTDHAANTRRRRDDRRVRVLFVGRLEKRKGIDLLLEAVPPSVRGTSSWSSRSSVTTRFSPSRESPTRRSFGLAWAPPWVTGCTSQALFPTTHSDRPMPTPMSSAHHRDMNPSAWSCWKP